MKYAKFKHNKVIQTQPNNEYGYIEVDDSVVCGMIIEDGTFKSYSHLVLEGNSYKRDIESELSTRKKKALRLLRERANYVLNFVGLGIDSDEPDPAQKKIEYLQKAKWAKDRKEEIENGDINIDYSAYSDQAKRYNGLKDSLGIINNDVNETFVYIILALDRRADVVAGVVQNNRQQIENSINNCKTIEEIDSIVNRFDDIISKGL